MFIARKKIKRNLTVRIADSELNFGKSEFYLSQITDLPDTENAISEIVISSIIFQVNAGRGTRDLNRDKRPAERKRSAGLCDYFYYSASVVTEEPSSSSIRW